MERGAIISPCGLYRYRLWRRWGEGKSAVFIMLNPSTADAEKDDATIRRCIGFANRESCGGLVVVNLFAFRATQPKDMKAAADPIGPENDAHLGDVVWSSQAGPIIAAWGNHGTLSGRAFAVAHRFGEVLQCLGTTKEGQPIHPLRLHRATPLRPFWPDRREAKHAERREQRGRK